MTARDGRRDLRRRTAEQTCARPGCGETFTPNRRGRTRLYCATNACLMARYPTVLTVPWKLGDRRTCARKGCSRTFTVTRLIPEQRFCSFACIDGSMD